MTFPQVTHWHCPDAPGLRGTDNTTHHLINPGPNKPVVCTYCKRTRTDLIAETSIGRCTVCGCSGVRVKPVSSRRRGFMCVDAHACYENWVRARTKVRSTG